MKHLIDKKNLADQVYDHIKRMILSGELNGGQRVPEEHISRLFGVSRTPLREALKKLESYGLIYFKPRSYSEVVVITKDEALKIAELRVHLEKMAAKLFSRIARDVEYETLERLIMKCDRQIAENERVSALETDSLIHLYIAEQSGNKYLSEIYNRLDARVQLLRLNQKTPITRLTKYIRQHNELLDAIKNRDDERIDDILHGHIMHDL